MRNLTPIAFALLGVLSSGVAVQAQFPTRTNPAVSPYLNLYRPGGGPAMNYYNIVRPQIDFRSSINTLNQEVAANQQQISAQDTAAATATLPPTGHPVGFQTHSRYFMSIGGGGGTRGGFATMGAAGARPQVGAGRTSGSYGRSATPTRSSARGTR